jgi:hypothetical protein
VCAGAALVLSCLILLQSDLVACVCAGAVLVQAAKALEVCLRTIAPKILTWGQYADAAINLLQKTVMGRDLPEYVPDFTKCIDHFALHAGKAPQFSSSECRIVQDCMPHAVGNSFLQDDVMQEECRAMLWSEGPLGAG